MPYRHADDGRPCSWVSHHGRHFTLNGVTLSPGPVSVPIWIGGSSRAAQRRAARFDGWVPDTADREWMTMSPDALSGRLARIRGARENDEPFAVGAIGYSHPDGETSRAYAAAGATWWLESIHDLRGTPDDLLALVESGPGR